MKFRSCMAAILVCTNQALVAYSSLATQSGQSVKTQPRFDSTSASKSQAKSYNKNALHRLDFRILGTSCPVCLLSIQRRVKSQAGTIETAVMLKKPYGVSIIYDSKQVNNQKILETVTLNEPLIKLSDIKDEPIDKIPVILIPPHNEPSKNNTANLSIGRKQPSIIR